MRPHRWQPTRLPRPWDSPGMNTGVGCHFLLQCMKVKSEREVVSRVRLLETPWTVAYQAPLSMVFPRQEHCSGVPLPSPRLSHRRREFRLLLEAPPWAPGLWPRTRNRESALDPSLPRSSADLPLALLAATWDQSPVHLPQAAGAATRPALRGESVAPSSPQRRAVPPTEPVPGVARGSPPQGPPVSSR